MNLINKPTLKKKKILNSNRKKIISTFGIILLAFLLLIPNGADACDKYTGSLSKKNYTDKTGHLYFHISGDGKTSHIKFTFTRSNQIYYTNFVKNSSTWTVKIEGTNNHNVRFSNGGTSMSVSTKKDVDSLYTVFSIPLKMSLTAHYQYSRIEKDAYAIPDTSRLNLEAYHQQNNGTNTGSANMTHSSSTRDVSFNMQANALHCGISDSSQLHNGSWTSYYVSVLRLFLAKPSRTVTFVDGLGNTLKTQSVTDAGAATPPSNPTRTGYTFNGWSGTYSAPICSNRTITATWKVNTYTNTVYHWLWGFTKGEGNHTNKTGYNFTNPTFTANYGTTYTVGTNRSSTIPRGYYLSSSFGTSGISGSWASYSMGTTVTQKAYNMGYEYDYYPYTYNINYNLAGGTNNSANPSTYNVLYGVNFVEPTRPGYIFMGWIDESDNEITSINPGVANNFSSLSDMVSQLSTRTIGNKTLTATWVASEPPKIEINPNNNVSNPVAPFVDGENLVVQLGDSFNPLDYITIKDLTDENPVASVKETNLPLTNGVLTQSGTFTVTYKAENKHGLSSEKEITVIVNDPPVITSETRYVLPNNTILSTDFLLERVNATDKEDGNIKDKVIITSVLDDNSNVLALDGDNYGTTSIGKYKVTVEVTDSYNKTVTNTFAVICVNDLAAYGESHATYMRFISDELLSTLNEKSIYKINEAYKTEMESSLSKDKDDAQVSISYSADEVKTIKEFQAEQGNKRTQSINQLFTNVFIKTAE